LEQQFKIPYPDKGVFEHQANPTDMVTAETQYVNIIEKVDYESPNGIEIHLRGALFPSKGFPTPEAILAVNHVKRFLMGEIQTVMKTDLKYFLALAVFLPWKRKLKIFNIWVKDFVVLSDQILNSYYLKPERMSPLGRELNSTITKFLNELGADSFLVSGFARVISTLIDYDSAYRLRIEDLMSETSKELILVQPIQEIKNMLRLLVERDSKRKDLQGKFKAIGYALSALLLIPRIRKAFKTAIIKSDFKRFQLDEADRYHCLRMAGYEFLGRTIEDRFQEYIDMHHGEIPQMYVLNHK